MKKHKQLINIEIKQIKKLLKGYPKESNFWVQRVLEEKLKKLLNEKAQTTN
jgi:uncharacterized protein YqfB (UPF0267 family)